MFKKTVSGICNQFTAQLRKVVNEQKATITKTEKIRDKVVSKAINKIGVLENKIHAVEDIAQKVVNASNDAIKDAENEAQAAENAIANIEKVFGLIDGTQEDTKELEAE